MNCLNCTTCESDCQLKEVDTPSLFCMNCQPSEAPCLKICPNNAIEVLGGAITINEKNATDAKSVLKFALSKLSTFN